MHFAPSHSRPIQKAAANQRPPFIVHTQNIPAAPNSPAADHSPPEDFTTTTSSMDAIRRKESVCRSLFGPVDHEQLRRDLKLKLQEMSEQDMRRWNFNFQTDAPLPGGFQWEETPADHAAAFYQGSKPMDDAACSSNVEADARLSGCGEEAGTDQENCPRISNTLVSNCPAEVTPVRRKRALSKPPAKPGNNSRITDFFAKRRRTTTETKSIPKPFQTEAALCKTIR